ncbi:MULTISPECIES: NHL domain-containing protein [unclassified Frankia]|uniref:NHL domain-containing protein n=1 Tax=unclassified Frankia TaxID=2632575 RepID=UPI002023E300
MISQYRPASPGPDDGETPAGGSSTGGPGGSSARPPAALSLDRLVISTLADEFPDPPEARRLVDQAGLPPRRQPGWNIANAEQFWWETHRLFVGGAVIDGWANVLREAYHARPANSVLAAAAQAAGVAGPSPAEGSPPSSPFPGGLSTASPVEPPSAHIDEDPPVEGTAPSRSPLNRRRLLTGAGVLTLVPALLVFAVVHLTGGSSPTIAVVAGTGAQGFSGDRGPAIEAQLQDPQDVAVASDGTLYLADRGNQRIRRIDPDGTITIVAGNGTPGFSGDGGPAIDAQFNEPTGLAVTDNGTLYVADRNNHRIRKITPDRTITTVAGNGVTKDNGDGGFSGDRGPATQAQLFSPGDVAVAKDGTFYIADTRNHRIRKVTPDGTITTIAGNKGRGFSGDRGPAFEAQLNEPIGLAIVGDTLYIAEWGNHRIRRIAPDRTITTVAGNGATETDGGGGFSGDGGPATRAQLNRPVWVAVDTSGTLYISDQYNHRVRRVGPNGTITTVAGTGTSGFSGYGGPATRAQLAQPTGVVVDKAGILYISDSKNCLVSSIDTNR